MRNTRSLWTTQHRRLPRTDVVAARRDAAPREVNLLEQVLWGRRVGLCQGFTPQGKQPVLAPGESFQYTSYCPLRTSWGTMEGSYNFTCAEGTSFEVPVGRFFLVPEAGNTILRGA